MKDVRLFFFSQGEPQSLKACVGKRPIIVARQVTIHCRNRFDADAPEIVREGLEKRERFGHQPTMFRQEVSIAGLLELGDLFSYRQASQVVLLLRVHSGDVFAHCLREGRLGKEFRPGRRIHAVTRRSSPKVSLSKKAAVPIFEYSFWS